MCYISTFGASQQMPQIPAIKSAFSASTAAEQPLALPAIVYELLLNLKYEQLKWFKYLNIWTQEIFQQVKAWPNQEQCWQDTWKKKALTLTPSEHRGQIPAQTGGQRHNQYPPTKQLVRLPRFYIFFSRTMNYRVADFMPRWQMTEWGTSNICLHPDTCSTGRWKTQVSLKSPYRVICCPISLSLKSHT